MFGGPSLLLLSMLSPLSMVLADTSSKHEQNSHVLEKIIEKFEGVHCFWTKAESEGAMFNNFLIRIIQGNFCCESSCEDP